VSDERPDLAAMLHPLLRALIAAEMPVLAEHDVSMWGYAVLTALDDTPVRTQAALAEAIGADKSRIIGTLDELQQAGLIDRTPDPNDRRVRLLSMSAKASGPRRTASSPPSRQPTAKPSSAPSASCTTPTDVHRAPTSTPSRTGSLAYAYFTVPQVDALLPVQNGASSSGSGVIPAGIARCTTEQERRWPTTGRRCCASCTMCTRPRCGDSWSA
jgi:DNA-binding MarR family transcriptional regulator